MGPPPICPLIAESRPLRQGPSLYAQRRRGGIAEGGPNKRGGTQRHKGFDWRGFGGEKTTKNKEKVFGGPRPGAYFGNELRGRGGGIKQCSPDHTRGGGGVSGAKTGDADRSGWGWLRHEFWAFWPVCSFRRRFRRKKQVEKSFAGLGLGIGGDVGSERTGRRFGLPSAEIHGGAIPWIRAGGGRQGRQWRLFI